MVGAWVDHTFKVLGWTDQSDGCGILQMALKHPDYKNPKVYPVIRVIDYPDCWWMEANNGGNSLRIPKDGRWQFNGDFFSPTFTPSMLENKDYPASRRHYYVTDGKVEFLGDCADQDIAGKTFDLDDLTIRCWANGQDNGGEL